MTVAALIEKLKALPQDANVGYLWDGHVRTDADHVYLAKVGGEVVIAGGGEVCYSDSDRPADAPSAKEDGHWCTPKVERQKS